MLLYKKAQLQTNRFQEIELACTKMLETSNILHETSLF